MGIRALGVCTAELTVGGKDDLSLLRGGVWVLDDLQGSHSPDSRVQSDRAFVTVVSLAPVIWLVGGPPRDPS